MRHTSGQFSMTRCKILSVRICVAFLTLAFLPGSRVMAAAVQTPEQLQALFDQGQYAQLLPPLNKTLADKATIAAPATHFSLLMFKGETMLRMKSSSSAQDAFRAASLVIGADDNSVAVATANVCLLKRSGISTYQPKASDDPASKTKPAAIDILSGDSRKQAFAALFTDLMEPSKPVIATAEKATSLVTIKNALPALSELRSVEIAATGSDTQSKASLDKLAKHASDLMAAALKPMNGSITTISKAAAKLMRGASRTRAGPGGSTTNVPGPTMATGLSPQEVSSLDQIVSEARQISAAAGEMKSAFGSSGDFKTIKSDADKVIEEANKVLTDYHKPSA